MTLNERAEMVFGIPFEELAPHLKECVQKDCKSLAAEEMHAALKAARPYLSNYIAMTRYEGPGDRIALDMVDEAINKAEGKL